MAWFMDTIGPMTKTVADAAMLYQTIAGHDPRDPYTSSRPVTPFEPLADLHGVRVGVVRESIDNGMSTAEVADAVDAAMRVLEEAGASIADASLPLFDRGGLIANTLSDVEAAHTHRRWLRERPRDYDFATRRRLMAASLVPATAYTKLTRFRTLMRQHVMRELDRFDIIVTPAQPAGAPPIATETGLTSKEAVMGQFFGLRSHRSPFNLSRGACDGRSLRLHERRPPDERPAGCASVRGEHALPHRPRLPRAHGTGTNAARRWPRLLCSPRNGTYIRSYLQLLGQEPPSALLGRKA